jgi:hypothetical protein
MTPRHWISRRIPCFARRRTALIPLPGEAARAGRPSDRATVQNGGQL